jgi:hypothetical protein
MHKPREFEEIAHNELHHLLLIVHQLRSLVETILGLSPEEVTGHHKLEQNSLFENLNWKKREKHFRT